MKRFALIAGLMFLAAPAFANCKEACSKETMLRNPDGRTSITIMAGAGDGSSVNLGNFKAPEFVFSGELVHPTTNNLSLILRMDHSNTSWTSPFFPYTPHEYNFNVYSAGVRFFLP